MSCFRENGMLLLKGSGKHSWLQGAWLFHDSRDLPDMISGCVQDGLCGFQTCGGSNPWIMKTHCTCFHSVFTTSLNNFSLGFAYIAACTVLSEVASETVSTSPELIQIQKFFYAAFDLQIRLKTDSHCR